MDIQINELGSVKGQNWKEFTLKNDNRMEVSCLNYGGIITRIMAPDRNGNPENVVLGYRNYEDYLNNPNFFGALIGRVAGRIEGSSFNLDGVQYDLPKNEGQNHLHGGPTGFHQVIWDVEPFENEDSVGLILRHFSEDGDSGHPGNLTVEVTYSLNNDNDFSIHYTAVSDKKTAITMTNHSYFNLSGNLTQNILNHEVTLDASEYVELDDKLIPTGEIKSVENSVFDFRDGRLIDDGRASDDPQNKIAHGGYDHYFILDKKEKVHASVRDQYSGRKLDIVTDQPGMVMYTSNTLDKSHGLSHGNSGLYLGVCLETQASPASLHHTGFPSCIVDANEPYSYTTTFNFGTL